MPSSPKVEVPPNVEQTKPTVENDVQQGVSAKNFWSDARPTNKNPNFVRDYFQSSRLHFIGSFRARYESMMVAVGKRLKVHPSVLLRAPPKAKSTAERIILHIDMDCFFASIAVVKNPKLRGKCIAVCHGGGEISSCSYEARAYGVRAGVCVEAVSVDEAYLDITETIGKDDSQSSAEALVSNLRNRIQMETGCTASAGIGPSKLVARLATKGAKPNGQLRVRQENVIKYLDTLSVRDLPGIGWRTSKRLAVRDVTTVSQLRALSLIQLQEEFGDRQGQVFYDLARALDSRPVQPLKPRKSIGAEASWGVRFEKDETDKVNKFIEDIVGEVAARVTGAGAHGKKMTYKVYRRIPGSSMKGWKYLGHGPCTVLTKSAKLPSNCVGNAFKAALKERCLDIHQTWKIQHDEFRGVGLQVTDLVFADLSFSHSALPVNGTRRIDTFFAAANEKEKPLPKKRIDRQDKRPQTTEKIAQTENENVRHSVKADVPINSEDEDGIPIQASKGEALFPTNIALKTKIVKEDKIEPVPKGETKTERHAVGQARTGKTSIPLGMPEGWDIQVFEALPKELQTELLQGQNQIVPQLVAQNDNLNTVLNDNEIDTAIAGSNGQTRPAKRKRSVRQEQQQFERKTRRKQSAQITMTQCADISELKKRGHEVLNAEEFRERPLKEVVELLGDLKRHRKVISQRGGKGTTREKQGTEDEEEVNGERNGSTRKASFDIPSPPSLSSDSESSYGVAGAIEKQGFDHSRIYMEEDIWEYGSKLKEWMKSNASNIRTGHIELLRGRVLEMVHLKELDRACTELRVIQKYADEGGAVMRGWQDGFNRLLTDVQAECVRLYGFRLCIRPIHT